MTFKIVIISSRKSENKDYRARNKFNTITIKRNKKFDEAVNLPTVITLNPRSLYNKMDQFRTMVEQTEVGVCFISETWDRTHLKKGKLISESLEIEGYKWVRNVCQSNRGRGKPHILISEKDFHITEISPEPITFDTKEKVTRHKN